MKKVASLLVKSSIKWSNKFKRTTLHGLQEVVTVKYSPSHRIESECGWVSSSNMLLSQLVLRLFTVSVRI